MNRGTTGNGVTLSDSRFGRLFQWCLLGVLVFYAAYQSHYIVFRASYFKLQKLTVEGNKIVTDDQIVEMSGLELGMPVFNIDRDLVARRLYLLSRLENVKVLQKGAREVVISVSEKQPVARILLHGETVEVGPNGAIIGAATEGSSVLPWVLGVQVSPSGGGMGEHLEEGVADRLRIWLSRLKETALKGFSAISFPCDGKVIVMWNDIEFYLADNGAVDKNLHSLKELMVYQKTAGKDYQYVDLRFQDIAVRFQDIN